MKYNLSEIMRKAWILYRKGVAAFAECLHRAWNSAKAQPINAERIQRAQESAGVSEPVNHGRAGKPPDMRFSTAQRHCFRRC